MFSVLFDNVVFTAVADIDGEWIDGNTGAVVTSGELLGQFLGSQYVRTARYEYYRNGQGIYQLAPTGDYRWFCDVAVADTFEHLWS